MLITFGVANLAAGFTAAWLCDRLNLSPARCAADGTAASCSVTQTAVSLSESTTTVGEGRHAGPAELGDLLTNWGFDSPPQFVTLVAAQLLAAERLRDALTQLDTRLRSGPCESDLRPHVQHVRSAAATWRRLAAATAELSYAPEVRSDEVAVQRMSRDYSVELSAAPGLLGDEPRAHDARLIDDPRQEQVTRLLNLAYDARDVLQAVLVQRARELSAADRAALFQFGPRSFPDYAAHQEDLAGRRAEAGPHYVVRLGIDRFRRLTQQSGAAWGDALLAGCHGLFAAALESSKVQLPLRHLGGPLFELVCEGDHEQVQLLAETLRQSLEASSFVTGGQSCEVTASVAATPLAGVDGDLETRLQRALAAAHAAGCNRTAIDEGTPTIVPPAPVPVTRQTVRL